jgi:hypothetical protein
VVVNESYEHVPLVEGVEDRGVGRHGLGVGHERRVLERGDRQVRDRVQAGQVQRPRQPVDRVLVDRQLLG